ncbi:MAG: hypothetical protein Fues2KO_15130 [Fuerstiella sp.]
MAYASSLKPGGPDRVHFVLFSGGRRGTHLLIDLINSHTQVQCDSELLHPGRARPRMNSLDRFLDGHRRRSNRPIYGFKTSLHQLEEQTNPQAFLTRFCNSGGKVIYLQRTDHLRAAVSSIIAHRRKRYHDHSANPLAGQTFELDPMEVVRRVQRRISLNDAEANLLASIPHLHLEYERDLLHATIHQQTCNRVFELLGVDHCAVKTTMQKTSPPNLVTLIRNFDSVRAALKNHSLEHVLSEGHPKGARDQSAVPDGTASRSRFANDRSSHVA